MCLFSRSWRKAAGVGPTRGPSPATALDLGDHLGGSRLGEGWRGRSSG